MPEPVGEHIADATVAGGEAAAVTTLSGRVTCPSDRLPGPLARLRGARG